MRNLIANRAVQAVIVVLLLGATVGLASAGHPLGLVAGSAAPLPRAVSVNAITRACPAAGLAGSPAAQVALIAGPATSGSGQAVLRGAASPTGSPLASLTQPGVLTVTKVSAMHALKVPSPAATGRSTPSGGKSPSPSPSPSGAPVTTPVAGGVAVQATGAMARGLEAEQVTPTGAARCDSPGTDFWFAGPGQVISGHIELYLMNVNGDAADVNVQAFTDAGPLQGSTDTGIAVAPHAMVVQSLDSMLHNSRVMALHVRTSVGQVVAGVTEASGSAHGVWLPVAAPPATKVVLPGLPATQGTRQLYIGVPGITDAHITLTAVTSRGSYQPTGGSSLDIPGGSAVSVSLPSLSGIAGAVEVSASVPVTAAMTMPGGPAGTPGVFTAATPALQEQGIVADSHSGAGTTASLILTAPGAAVRVRLEEIGSGGQPQSPGAGQVVQIPAHHTVVQRIKAPPGSKTGTPYATVLTPLAGSGPLYAGRALTTGGVAGKIVSLMPVPSALTSVPLPRVLDSLITPAP